MAELGVGLVGLVLGALAVWVLREPAASSRFPGGPPVGIRLGPGNGIAVDPKHVAVASRRSTVANRGRVRWKVVGPSTTDYVRITFETKGKTEGPFPQDGGRPGENPRRGVYELKPGADHLTLEEDVSREEDTCSFAWKYDVERVTAEGDVVKKIDPMVVIGDEI